MEQRHSDIQKLNARLLRMARHTCLNDADAAPGILGIETDAVAAMRSIPEQELLVTFASLHQVCAVLADPTELVLTIRKGMPEGMPDDYFINTASNEAAYFLLNQEFLLKAHEICRNSTAEGCRYFGVVAPAVALLASASIDVLNYYAWQPRPVFRLILSESSLAGLRGMPREIVDICSVLRRPPTKIIHFHG